MEKISWLVIDNQGICEIQEHSLDAVLYDINNAFTAKIRYADYVVTADISNRIVYVNYFCKPL